MSWREMLRPGMRAYLIPLVSGVVLAVSAFLPWVIVGDVTLRGVPDTMALWIVGLGALASVLAVLSLITRKNSRHPLLVIGLAALGIMVLSWRILPETAERRARSVTQAYAIVEGRTVTEGPDATAGTGIYLGLLSAAAIVGFGLTIVVRRAAVVYAVTDPDDDV